MKDLEKGDIIIKSDNNFKISRIDRNYNAGRGIKFFYVNEEGKESILAASNDKTGSLSSIGATDYIEK